MADINLNPVVVGPDTPAAAPSMMDQFKAKLLGAPAAVNSAVSSFADQHPDTYAALRAKGPIGAGLEAMGVIPPIDQTRASAFAPGVATSVPTVDNIPNTAGTAISVGNPVTHPGAVNVPASVSFTQPAQRLQMPGGGYGGGMSPMGGLQAAVNADNKELLGTYDTQKDHTYAKADLEGRAMTAAANVQQIAAEQAKADAAHQLQVDNDAAERFKNWSDQTAQKVDALAQVKLDPMRMMSQKGAGERFMMTLGGAIGGVLHGAGLTNSNEFIDGVNKQIDRDLDSQRSEIEGKQREVAMRNTLLGQFQGIHGDQRLAEMQAKHTMLDATKNWLQAQADKEFMPALAKQNALTAMGLINREQVGIKREIDATALRAAQQQAAAAAAAQAAAQKMAWDRSMQVADMQLKRDTLAVEAAKAGGKDRDQLDAQITDLSKRIGDEKMVKDRQLVEDIKRRLQGADGQTDPSKGLPGVGPTADARNAIAPSFADSNTAQKVATFLPTTALPMAILRGTVGLNSDEKVSRQDWENAKLAYRNLRTGSGGSSKELEEIGRAFEGSATAQEQANTITKLSDYYARQEATAKAGYDPRAVSIFEQRLKSGANAPMPSSVKVK